jgi:hypothetical protein
MDGLEPGRCLGAHHRSHGRGQHRTELEQVHTVTTWTELDREMLDVHLQRRLGGCHETSVVEQRVVQHVGEAEQPGRRCEQAVGVQPLPQ